MSYISEFTLPKCYEQPFLKKEYLRMKDLGTSFT